MWRPLYEIKQNFISRWLQERKLKSENVQETQFEWKQIHKIEKPQKALEPNEKSERYIPKEAKTVYPKESAVEIRLCSTAAGKAEIYIYAARKSDGIVNVAEGLVKTGDRWLIRDMMKCYCVDDINIRGSWLSDIKIAQCRDDWSRIMFVTHGYNRVFARLNFANGIWYVDMVGAP